MASDIRVKDGDIVMSRCPHCQIATPLLELKQELERRPHGNRRTAYRYWKIYACSSCAGVVAAEIEETERPPATGGMALLEVGSPIRRVERYNITQVLPSPKLISESIPSRAREYLRQASESLHAPAGSIILCASAVDAMLQENGYIEGTLFGRINKAKENHLITGNMALWANQVRLDANEQRHADTDAELPTSEEAELTLEFASALAEFLFVLPSKVTRGLEKSGKSKSKESSNS